MKKSFEDHQFIKAPHVNAMGLVDVDIKQVVADVVADNPDIEVEYADVMIYLLNVTVQGVGKQWMSLSLKRVRCLAKYFFHLQKLMPDLKMEVSFAKLEGENAQLVYKEGMERDTLYNT